MLLERTNLQRHLEKLRDKEISEEKILEEVRKILKNEKDHDLQVLERIKNPSHVSKESNKFQFDFLSQERIFHISQIKIICTNYRLRFLNARYYKGTLPQEAITAVRYLERTHETNLDDFQILAPAEFFRLENADDPMLFVPLGNSYYYLIHKWGQDIHPLRKLIVWPMKHLENLLVFILVFSFLLTFGIREVFFARYQVTSEFLILFMYTFKSIIALIFFYGISLGKNFSSGSWNSKFYNS